MPVVALKFGINRGFHGMIIRQSIQFVFPWSLMSWDDGRRAKGGRKGGTVVIKKRSTVIGRNAWALRLFPLPLRPLSRFLYGRILSPSPPGEHLLRIQSMIWIGLILWIWSLCGMLLGTVRVKRRMYDGYWN